jgi:hypothetical protein
MSLTARFHGLKHECDHPATHRSREEHSLFFRLDVQPDLFWAVARVPCPEKLARTVEAGEKRSVADVHDHEALAELPFAASWNHDLPRPIGIMCLEPLVRFKAGVGHDGKERKLVDDALTY